MKASEFPEIGEELFLLLEAVKRNEPGEDLARTFARTGSAATPEAFADSLRRILIWVSLFYREVGLSAQDACDQFEAVATREYAILRAASVKQTAKGSVSLPFLGEGRLTASAAVTKSTAIDAMART